MNICILTLAPGINPKGGTPLMLAAPSIAIDLPLKIFVAEDGQGKVRVSYSSPECVKERHGLPENLVANIAEHWQPRRPSN
jgi:uncharacterized protein (DUF302 family)